jgi:hypothetical protein
MTDVIIYRDRPDNPHYNSRTGSFENFGGCRKMIAYTSSGFLCVLDHERGAEVIIPVSRWKLVDIGLTCIWAAFKR